MKGKRRGVGSRDMPDFLKRLGSPALRKRLEQRATLMRALRASFDHAGFLEVETGQLVDEPGQEPTLEPFRCGDRFLITSPELRMKQMLCAGYERIYELGHCFRSGLGETSPLHNPEFTMLEWYRADAGRDEILADVDRLLRDSAAALDVTDIRRGGSLVALDSGIEIVTVEEAFQRHANVDLTPFLAGDHAAFRAVARTAEYPVHGDGEEGESLFFRIFLDRIEAKLGTERPTALVNWPASMAALARLDDEDPRVAQRFEIYVAGVELANGFVELTDAAEQRRRFEAERDRKRQGGLDPGPFPDRFMRALEHGLPRSAGIALGVDRLLLLLTGAESLSELLAFPEDPKP